MEIEDVEEKARSVEEQADRAGVGDMDGEGDVSLVTGGEGEGYLLLNVNGEVLADILLATSLGLCVCRKTTWDTVLCYA